MKRFKLSALTLSLFAISGCHEEVKYKYVETSSSSNMAKGAVVAEVSSDFQKLQSRVVPDLIASEEKRAAKNGGTLSSLAQEYLIALQDDGSWQGIDYASTDRKNWPSKLHLERLRVIAAAFAQTGNSEFEQAAIKALSYWFQVDPSAHWWWEEIGKPNFLGPVGMMLGESLPLNLRFETANILPWGIGHQDSWKLTGANRTDIAMGVLYRGLLTEDSDLVGTALKDIEGTIVISTEEGIQEDLSFQQHGKQLYTGGYGESFFNPVIRWAYNVNDLQWKFSQEKIDILTNFYLDGMRWMTRSNTLDYNVSGRSITRENAPLTQPTEGAQQIKLDSMTTMDMVAALSPERAAEALVFKEHVYNDGPSGINGFKHFWRSDYSVKVTDDHLFGIKMNSKRIEPTETGNGENLLGYWLGFGSTFLMQRGDEYHNIFPVWDWKLIPGVTAPEYEEASAWWGEIMQPDVSFVGGVSNDKFGVSAMDMNINITHLERIESDTSKERGKRIPLIEGGGNTKAKKAWFSFNDEVVALGAGIHSTHSENVNTTLNQTLLNGTVTVDGTPLDQGNHDIYNANWVHHDLVGYIFPEQGQRMLSNRAQTGSWQRINSGQSAEVVSKDVFTLRIPHGVQPDNGAYQYIILPGKTAEETATYYLDLPIAILENSTRIQAVRHDELKVSGIVFHQAGSIVLNSDLTLSVDQPSIVLLDESGSEPVVTLSTPDQVYAKVNLTLDSKARGEAVTQLVITQGKPERQGSSITFPFYKGADNQAVLDEIAQTKVEEDTSADSAAVEKQAAADKMASDTGLVIITGQDAFVRGGTEADKVFGTNSYMGVENHTLYDHLKYKSLLRFDMTSLAGNKATSAKLKIYLRNVNARGEAHVRLQAYAVEVGDWTEKTMTWNRLPAIEGAATSNVLSLVHEEKDKWIELDITDIVNQLNGATSLDLVLSNPDLQNGYIGLSTREHDGENKAPHLVLK